METYSIDEILEQAIRTEKLGYQFYTGMAARFAKDNELRSLFLSLADVEMEHEKLYSGMKDLIDQSVPATADREEVSQYMRAIVESEFFLGNKKSLAGMDRITSITEAVRFALGFEKETLLYFIGLRDVVPQKDVVDIIMDEERSHIRALSALKNRLAKRDL
jgi:rubrerythrin